MSTAIIGDLIVLNLQNLSSVDSEVNLFSYEGNVASVDSYSVIFVRQNVMSVQGYFPSGIPFNQTITSTDITDFINQLNANSVSWFGVQATFTMYGTRLIITDVSNAIFTSITGLVVEVYYFFSYNQLIKDTTISVQTVGTDLSYSELVSELIAQPYLIESLNVYAGNIQQVGVRWKKATRELNGTSYTDFDMPRTDPMQKQFAIEGIPVNFTPSPINYLNYRVKGNQSVRLFFYYKYKDKLDLRIVSEEKKTNSPGSLTIENINIEKMKKDIKLPLFELTRPKTRSKISIKEKLSSKIVSKDVTNEEIYTAFDGMDFKQY